MLCVYIYSISLFPSLYPLLYIPFFISPSLYLRFPSAPSQFLSSSLFISRNLFIYLASTLLFSCFFLICIFLAIFIYLSLSFIILTFSLFVYLHVTVLHSISPSLCLPLFLLSFPPFLCTLSFLSNTFFLYFFLFLSSNFPLLFPLPFISYLAFFLQIPTLQIPTPFSYLLPVLTRLEQQFVKPVVRMSNYSPSALTLQTFTKTNKIVSLNYKLTAISAGFGKSDSSFGRVRNFTRARHFKGVISMYTVQNIWRNRLRCT